MYLTCTVDTNISGILVLEKYGLTPFHRTLVEIVPPPPPQPHSITFGTVIQSRSWNNSAIEVEMWFAGGCEGGVLIGSHPHRSSLQEKFHLVRWGIPARPSHLLAPLMELLMTSPHFVQIRYFCKYQNAIMLPKKIVGEGEKGCFTIPWNGEDSCNFPHPPSPRYFYLALRPLNSSGLFSQNWIIFRCCNISARGERDR